MEIITKSIQEFLRDNLKQYNTNDFSYQELLFVEGITVDGQDENGEKQKVNFMELKLLKNLKYLEIRNIVISNYMIDILKDMTYLENIIFRNCTFRSTITTMNKIKDLKQLRIENCKNFNLEYIDKLHIDNLTLSNITLTNINILKNNLVKVLDISRANIMGNINFNIDIQKLVVSHKDFEKNKRKFKDVGYEIIIMAEDGFYIEI